jgi:hypothetical protein
MIPLQHSRGQLTNQDRALTAEGGSGTYFNVQNMYPRDNGEIGKSDPILSYCDYFGKGLLEESSGRNQEAAEG